MDYYCSLCRARTPHREVLSHWDNNYYVDKRPYTLLRCQSCDLVEVEDKPTGDALARYYRDTYYAYDTSGNVFFKIKGAAWRLASSLPRLLADRLLLNQLYAFPPAVADPAVLDVGCGDGSALQAMKALGFTRLHGTEIHPSRRSLLERKGIEVVITSDITKAGLPQASFDVVRLSHVLEHVNNPSETISKCWELLKSGGKLLLAVPNFDSPARRVFGRYFCALQLPTHLYHFNRSNLRQLLNAHRFLVKKQFTVGYSGFSSSVMTLLKDRYGIEIPSAISTAFILVTAPLEAVFNLMGLGYIITVEALKP
jgi:SAM-dependent methyltransferase